MVKVHFLYVLCVDFSVLIHPHFGSTYFSSSLVLGALEVFKQCYVMICYEDERNEGFDCKFLVCCVLYERSRHDRRFLFLDMNRTSKKKYGKDHPDSVKINFAEFTVHSFECAESFFET